MIGLTGVVAIALCSQWVLFSPEQLADPKFKLAGASFKWAVSGFGNSTVWLIFGAFMFAAGYDKTRFGRRLALILVKYWPSQPDARLRHYVCGPAAGPVYPVQYRAQRWDHLPDHRQPAAAVRFKTQRPKRAQNRFVSDVGGNYRGLYHQLDVPFRSGT